MLVKENCIDICPQPGLCRIGWEGGSKVLQGTFYALEYFLYLTDLTDAHRHRQTKIIDANGDHLCVS